MKSISEIKDKLNELKILDKKFEIFGAASHEYEFNEPIPIEKLNQFEEKYGIELPKDYKSFLSEIGNGGAGPFYGIYPLQRDLGRANPENKFEFLKFNFPHKKAWNWSDKIFDKFDEFHETEEDEIIDFFDDVYWEQYFKDELTYGSIYITEYGCALRFLLVITGAEKGKIWFDQRADRNGLNPITNKNGNKLDFSDWYVNWLDTSITEMKEK